MSQKLKRCPICKNPGSEQFGYVSCSNPSCALSFVDISPAQWNSRPIEDALLAALERLTNACKKSHDFCCIDGRYTDEVDEADAAISYAKGGES